jgi:hypothetical protein
MSISGKLFIIDNASALLVFPDIICRQHGAEHSSENTMEVLG